MMHFYFLLKKRAKESKLCIKVKRITFSFFSFILKDSKKTKHNLKLNEEKKPKLCIKIKCIILIFLLFAFFDATFDFASKNMYQHLTSQLRFIWHIP